MVELPRDLEVVFFDAGHTLLEPDPPVAVRYCQAAAAHGAVDPSPAVVRERFEELWTTGHEARARELLKTDDLGTRRFWYDFVGQVLEPWTGQIRDYDAFFDELYEAFATPKAWRLFDDVTPGLEGIASLGLRLGVISNWDKRLSALLEVLGLADRFEAVLSSAEVGYEKPAGEIFAQALERLDVGPERALHVGDSLNDDVRGALAAGITAVHLDREGSAPSTSAEERPYLVVSTITELADRLG